MEDRAYLYIYDAKPGQQIARKALGTTARSTPLYADGKIYYCTNSGQWYILKPTDDGVAIVHRLRLPDEDNDGSPIVSHGRIFLPTSAYMYCLGKADHQPQADPLPELPKENPIADHEPAHVQ